MKNISWRLAFLGAGLFVLIWAAALISYVRNENFDALWLLTLATIPLSSLVSQLDHKLSALLFASHETKFALDFASLLVVGIVEYGLIGYLLGKLIVLMKNEYGSMD